jgi:hypothetical protein
MNCQLSFNFSIFLFAFGIIISFLVLNGWVIGSIISLFGLLFFLPKKCIIDNKRNIIIDEMIHMQLIRYIIILFIAINCCRFIFLRYCRKFVIDQTNSTITMYINKHYIF